MESEVVESQFAAVVDEEISEDRIQDIQETSVEEPFCEDLIEEKINSENPSSPSSSTPSKKRKKSKKTKNKSPTAEAEEEEITDQNDTESSNDVLAKSQENLIMNKGPEKAEIHEDVAQTKPEKEAENMTLISETQPQSTVPNPEPIDQKQADNQANPNLYSGRVGVVVGGGGDKKRLKTGLSHKRSESEGTANMQMLEDVMKESDFSHVESREETIEEKNESILEDLLQKENEEKDEAKDQKEPKERAAQVEKPQEPKTMEMTSEEEKQNREIEIQKEKIEMEQKENERVDQEKKEKAENEKIEQEKIEQEKVEQQLKLEQEKVEREQKAEQEKIEQEKANKAKVEQAEKIERAEKAEKEEKDQKAKVIEEEKKLKEEKDQEAKAESYYNRETVAGESLSASSGNYASSEEEEKALWAIWRNKAEPEKGETPKQGASTVFSLTKLIPLSIFADLPMSDPLSEMVSRHFGPEHGISRALISINEVEQNINGLKKLMNSDSWRAAALLAERLFNESIDSYPIENVMQIFLCRITSLIKLRLYSIAQQELWALGNLDRPEMFYEHYPTTFKGKRGSIVPFSIRVIAADLPRYFPNLPNSSNSIDQPKPTSSSTANKDNIAHNPASLAIEGLSQLLVSVRGVLRWISRDDSLRGKTKEVALKIWKDRERKLSLMILNHLCELKDYYLATSMMEEIVRENKNDIYLQSALGRLHLQLGNLTDAKTVFGKVKALIQNSKTHEELNWINEGYLSMSAGNFRHAAECFERVVFGPKGQNNLAASSNLAICYLYLGNLKQAITTLETVLKKNPSLFVNETLLFNLSTLYELESDQHMEKKKALLKLASAYLGDQFNVDCLKNTA